MLKARQSEVRAIRRLPSEPASWLPQPSVRQAAAATRESDDPKVDEVTLIGPPETPAAQDGVGDFCNLADSIADMRRRRNTQAETDKPRSWLDEVRENVDRRRAAARDERPAAPAEAEAINRLTEMVEALQERIERLEADNAALSARSARLEGRTKLRLAPPPRKVATDTGTNTAQPARPGPAKMEGTTVAKAARTDKPAPPAGSVKVAEAAEAATPTAEADPSPAAGMQDIADALRAIQSGRPKLISAPQGLMEKPARQHRR